MLIVLECNNISYISYKKSYSSMRLDLFYINGKLCDTLAPGDKRFLRFEGVVEKIEEKKTHHPKILGYSLKEQFKHLKSEQIPEKLEKNYFDNDSERDIYNLYEAVYSEKTYSFVPREFEFVKVNASPEQLPNYIVSDFPYVKEYEDYLHCYYPCSVNKSWLFKESADRIIKFIQSSSEYDIEYHKNIELLNVCKLIKLPYRETTHILKPEVKGKSIKWVSTQVEIKTKKISLFKIKGPESYHKYNDYDVLPVIKGENLNDVNKNLKEYFDNLLDIFNKVEISICDHCGGYGTIKIQSLDKSSPHK